MSMEDAYGFVDPVDMLRGCHLIPAFAKGWMRPANTVLFPLSKDSDHWKYYYINKFVDRDMLMRYHWGLGVGHTYSHVRGSDVNQAKSSQVNPECLYSCSFTLNSAFETALDTSLVTGGASQRFDDLDNNFSLTNLGWDSYENYDCGKAESELGRKDISESFLAGDASPTFTNRFNDLDPSLSLMDLDALDWALYDEKDEDECECVSDDDLAAFVMYEMYGSDWGDGESE
ncbi:hypothetical protein JVT61DRAFT_1616 [Boletus reticuloceps]|uniref:Uncharacterized protein n=1 Tax=Boletus reticuloceps TaxID=495285 RepID=A0A8I2YRP0_9AGAM|nr:hypothetical protein JVT61DRAFT_1616 [Boletus reticuloceps]